MKQDACMMVPYFRVRRVKQAVTLILATMLLLFISSILLGNNNKAPILKKEILQLSEEYLHEVASRQRNIQDGPVAVQNTAYDMKKTLAILLETIVARLASLEKRVFGTNGKEENQQVSANEEEVSFVDLLAGKQENCSIPGHLKSQYPSCQVKLEWMKSFWQSDPCYAKHGVDGTKCTFYVYLSEVESHCPPLPWRIVNKVKPKVEKAELRTSVDGLFDAMSDNADNYRFIKTRLTHMWPHWMLAAVEMKTKQNWTLVNRPKKRILIHLGLLTKETNFKFGEKSLKGGPLGELVQWADLIACLYILGHDLFISSESKTFISFAQADTSLKSSCPLNSLLHVDLIYTDIVGFRQMKKKIPGSIPVYKCRIRVLDSFGTEAEFNDNSYFMKHKKELGGGKMKNHWGGHLLNLQQFYTMYPHSPDNTFLGFVVETFAPINNTEEVMKSRENWALIYGKEAYMWKGHEKFISTVHEFFPVHSTVSNTEAQQLPGFVTNHGVLSGSDFHRLLQKVKVFVGFGFPYEGPAPLEAIANGALFLNPVFLPPKGRRTDKFFSEKPTLRALTSQNPYVEQFIGPPYVFSIDISNLSLVRETLSAAKNTLVSSFLPFEFTCAGMLQRVNVFVQHQDFCTASHNWPPFSACQITVSNTGQSCKDACAKKDLMCEYSYFAKINNEATVKEYGKCREVLMSDAVTSPQFDSYYCHIQQTAIRFSCSASNSTMRRVCPCRDFIKDQTALCTACL